MTEEDARVVREWRVYSIRDPGLPRTDEVVVGFGDTERMTLHVTRNTPESDMLYEALRTRAGLRMTLERMEERR